MRDRKIPISPQNAAFTACYDARVEGPLGPCLKKVGTATQCSFNIKINKEHSDDITEDLVLFVIETRSDQLNGLP